MMDRHMVTLIRKPRKYDIATFIIGGDAKTNHVIIYMILLHLAKDFKKESALEDSVCSDTSKCKIPREMKVRWMIKRTSPNSKTYDQGRDLKDGTMTSMKLSMILNIHAIRTISESNNDTSQMQIQITETNNNLLSNIILTVNAIIRITLFTQMREWAVCSR